MYSHFMTLRPALDEHFNKRCSYCEFYPWKLPSRLIELPYYGATTWKLKVFGGSDLYLEIDNRGTHNPSDHSWNRFFGMDLDSSFMAYIYGDKYVAGYQWQNWEWILVEKRLRA